MPDIPSCDIALPVSNGIETTFFVQITPAPSMQCEATIDLTTPDGVIIKKNAFALNQLTHSTSTKSQCAMLILKDLSEVSQGACFRLKCNSLYYSSYAAFYPTGVTYTDTISSSDTGITKQTQLVKMKGSSSAHTIKIRSFRVYYYGSNGVPYDVENVKISVIHEATGTEVYNTSVGDGYKDVEFSLSLTDGDLYIIYAQYRQDYVQETLNINIQHSGIIYGDPVKETTYSNLLRRVDDNNFAIIKYSCDEDAFGFPFSHTLADGTHPYLQLQLPIILNKPQYKQTDKIYETLSGKRIVLYATINKEYEAQTEYIHDDWHQKNIIALCCDHVTINGESLVRSESYEINWEDYTETECGIKLAMATFKMQANINQRNSNHG